MTDLRGADGAPGRDGRAWLDRMPGRVAAHRALLQSLLETAQSAPWIRWLELGGSLARDAGDELSDIDAGLGIADGQWPEAVAAAEEMIGRAAAVADGFRQPFPGKGDQQCWHLVTLYQSGLQLSLVVMPASWRPGLPPQAVALYDADGRLASPWAPESASAGPDQAREWACLAWLALGDLAKYLERGSEWEARARLEDVRDFIWRLWGLAAGAVYPAFGLTSVLDTPGCRLPEGIEATAAGLAAAATLDAADAAAGLLEQAGRRAAGAVPFRQPDGLRTWARSRLASVRRSLAGEPGAAS